jgi:predicted RNase H-like nuclease (RuvC/YqgF family)
LKIIGIDPGANTGIALFDGENLIELLEGDFWTAIEYIADIKPDCVVIEDSRKESFVWNSAAVKNVGAALKIARNVGEIDGAVKNIERFLEKVDVPVVLISPTKKGSKVNAERFKQITQWEGPTNEHKRDAAMVVLAARFELRSLKKRA